MDATTFPISLTYHIVFCAVACIFFVIQYVRTKKSYQLLLAIGIPASLFIYIKPDNSSLFYTVGVFETIILIGALIFAIIERNRRKQEIEDYRGNTKSIAEIFQKSTLIVKIFSLNSQKKILKKRLKKIRKILKSQNLKKIQTVKTNENSYN